MGLRETINQKQHMTTILTASIIVVAVGLIVWQLIPESPPKPPTLAYYSTDDGGTWFEDKIDRVTPFKKDGKDAFRAHIYRCGKDQPFCGWLESFTPDAKKILDTWYANPANKDKFPEKRYELEETSKMVKKPGQPGWMPMRSTRADTVTLVTCPDQQPAQEVYPEE